MFVPGDERSRQYPGYGYPEHYEDTVKYRAFLKRDDWEAAIHEMIHPKFGSPKTNFFAAFIKQAKIESVTKVEIAI